jgi:hypothetical protein
MNAYLPSDKSGGLPNFTGGEKGSELWQQQ